MNIFRLKKICQYFFFLYLLLKTIMRSVRAHEIIYEYLGLDVLVLGFQKSRSYIETDFSIQLRCHLDIIGLFQPIMEMLFLLDSELMHKYLLLLLEHSERVDQAADNWSLQVLPELRKTIIQTANHLQNIPEYFQSIYKLHEKIYNY